MFQLFPILFWAKNQPALPHAGSEIQSPRSGFGQLVYSNRCNGVMWFYLFIFGQKKGVPSVLSEASKSGGDALSSLSFLTCVHMLQ